MYQTIVDCYINYLEFLLPILVVFGLGNMCVSTILRAAFGEVGH